MPRQFDKYGWNVQYKYHPCSRKNPFPHDLPFCTDFSHRKAVASQKKPKRNDYVRPGPYRPPIRDAVSIFIPQSDRVTPPLANHDRKPLPDSGRVAGKYQKESVRKFDAMMFGSLALIGAAGILFGAPAVAVGALGAAAADGAGVEMAGEEFWTYRSALREAMRDSKPKMD